MNHIHLAGQIGNDDLTMHPFDYLNISILKLSLDINANFEVTTLLDLPK
ncbi:hypothetical protein [Staphylococcus argenteus]|nr:hypothetical protein [Staphylococcus argenteus]MBE2133246.1 hypothetical protein [Staphylococcus argenteus]MBE2160943.1 hypothetical protein [Staphylococcus argenteus]MCG9807992.1 hypothetical protein [Staphylococcus argenteus]MCG9821309.1 hypothetical protein [Staphylococcus argenteus]MCG9830067.1 hypothetical protein [Staphylococcus argenteus]